MIFAVLAAFVVSLSFTACSSKEEQAINKIKDMVSYLKDKHIKNADDAKEVAEKMADYQKEFEALSKEIEDKTKDMSEEEKEKYNKEMEDKYKKDMEKAMEEMMTEILRLSKEAREAGVDLELKGF